MFSLGLDIFWRTPEMWCLQDCCVRLRLLAKFKRKEGNPTQYIWHGWRQLPRMKPSPTSSPSTLVEAENKCNGETRCGVKLSCKAHKRESQ